MIFLLSFLTVLFVVAASVLALSTDYSRSVRWLAGLSAWLSIALLFARYLADRFTDNGINSSLVFHLRQGLAGAGFAEYRGLMLSTIAAALLLTGGLYYAFLYRRPGRKQSSGIAVFCLVLVSFLVNPGIHDVIGLINVSDNSAEFRTYARSPQIEQIAQPRNLILIYAEGLEYTYFDETIFPDLLPHLKDLEKEAVSFTNLYGAPHTDWTIGGIVGSQLGLPLLGGSSGNSMSGVDSFMPGARGLGDVLNEEGYFLSYLGGASLAFAGKGNFFKSHGFSEVLGRELLQTRLPNPDYVSGWGLYDDSLLQFVYDRYENLSQEETPFALAMLTLDTHNPAGHPSSSCDHIQYQDGSNEILNAVACSDWLISQFVRKIQASPSADETVIVFLSDHLAKENTASNLLEQGNRTNTFMIFDTTIQSGYQVDSYGNTYDIATTILPFIGYQGEIGLGRNLLEADDAQQAERKYIEDNVSNWQAAVTALWEFPKLNDQIRIDPDLRQIYIDDKQARIPILIFFDEELNTDLLFEFERSPGQTTLFDFISSAEERSPYLWIGDCTEMENFNVFAGNEESELCLLTGNGEEVTLAQSLIRPLTLSSEAVNELLDTNQRIESTIPFGEVIELSGISVTEPASNTIALTLELNVLQQITEDYTLFVHVLGEEGDILAQIDQKLGRTHPTSLWKIDEQWIVSVEVPKTPEMVAEDEYELRFGFYTWPTLEHLLVGVDGKSFVTFDGEQFHQ